MNISLDELKKIVIPEQDDPLLYEGYVLDKEQLDHLAPYAVSKIENPDFDTYLYVLECWAS